MVRPMSFLLSFWLALLFVVGQGAHIPQLLVAAVGLGALVAGLGGLVAPLASPRLRIAVALALSIGLLALADFGLTHKVSPWLPWCVLMGAVWYLGVVGAEALWSPRNRGTMAPADS